MDIKDIRFEPIRHAVLEGMKNKDFYENIDSIFNDIYKNIQVFHSKKLQTKLNDISANIFEELLKELRESLDNVRKSWEVNFQDLMLYPSGTRLAFMSDNVRYVVVETKPHVRTLNFSEGRYRLAMPFTIFVFRFSNGVFLDSRIFWNNKPLSSIDDQLYQVMLPNIQDNISCMGSDFRTVDSGINENIENYIHYWWRSAFNEDLTEQIRTGFEINAKESLKFTSLSNWHDLTSKDPMFILGIKMTPAGTLSSYLPRVSFEADKSSFTRSVDFVYKSFLCELSNKLATSIDLDLDAISLASSSQDTINSILREIVGSSYMDIIYYLSKLKEKKND